MNIKVTQAIVNNYLVPASGQTHCEQLSGVYSAVPFIMDWMQFKVDNFAFIPQGVFIDNTQGVSPLVINIQPIGFNVVCPAGVSGQFQFPATANQYWSITGNGQASIFAVDFPVLPNGQNTNIANTPNVNIVSADNSASPVFVEPTPNAGGLPYQSQKIPYPLTYEYLSTTGAAANVAPGAVNLRKLKLTISGDAALAAAGRDLITVTLNGTPIFKVSPFIPAAAGTGAVLAQYDVAFDDAALNAGAGNLTVQAASVLTSGVIELNAWFD